MTTTYKDSYQVSKNLTPSEFLNLSEEEKSQIENLEISTPKLGSSSMGTFKVTFSSGSSFRIKKQ